MTQKIKLSFANYLLYVSSISFESFKRGFICHLLLPVHVQEFSSKYHSPYSDKYATKVCELDTIWKGNQKSFNHLVLSSNIQTVIVDVIPSRRIWLKSEHLPGDEHVACVCVLGVPGRWRAKPPVVMCRPIKMSTAAMLKCHRQRRRANTAALCRRPNTIQYDTDILSKPTVVPSIAGCGHRRWKFSGRGQSHRTSSINSLRNCAE